MTGTQWQGQDLANVPWITTRHLLVTVNLRLRKTFRYRKTCFNHVTRFRRTGSARPFRAITAMHVFALGASDTEPTIGTLVTLLSALLKTTQCRHDPRGSEQQQLWWSSRTNNIPQLESHEAYQCYADHGYFTDTRFIDGNVPDARFVLNTRRIDNWVASMHHRLPQKAVRKANCSSFPDCPHQVESLLYARVQKVMWLSGELNRHFQSRDNFIAMRVEDFESLSHGAFIHKTSALALALALVLALEH